MTTDTPTRCIRLVAMPWQPPQRPSMALGILTSVIRERTGWDVAQIPAYVDWLGTLLAADIDPPFRAQDYIDITLAQQTWRLGDWVFTPALYDQPGDPPEPTGYRDRARAAGVDLGRSAAMRAVAPGFVDAIADRVLADRPAVVGCSTLFTQTTASLALLRAVKRRDPDVLTVLGGPNCDGPMGAGLHRAFPFVDLVVRGEGEPAVVALLAALDQQDDASRAAALAAVPGLCWRDPGGPPGAPPRVNPPRVELWDGYQDNPAADHDAYFATFRRYGLDRHLRAELVIEASRGCWWGEKHHCTFCGLNGQVMTSRVRPTERVLAELVEHVARYRVDEVVAVDNILAREHLRDLLPRIAEADLGVSIHWEVKSNLRDEELSLLSAAGSTRIQPGIESLITPVLQLMNKGVTALQNVRTLRDATRRGIRVGWNMLYGFAGEQPEDYAALIDRLPDLWHLPPPAWSARIALMRFSPNLEDPTLGFADHRPALGPLPWLHPGVALEDLADITGTFETPPQGLKDPDVASLDAAIDAWRSAFGGAYLWLVPRADRDLIYDGRRQHRVISLDSDDERELFRLVMKGASRKALSARSKAAERFIARWEAERLVFVDDERVLALPIELPLPPPPGTKRSQPQAPRRTAGSVL